MIPYLTIYWVLFINKCSRWSINADRSKLQPQHNSIKNEAVSSAYLSYSASMMQTWEGSACVPAAVSLWTLPVQTELSRYTWKKQKNKMLHKSGLYVSSLASSLWVHNCLWIKTLDHWYEPWKETPRITEQTNKTRKPSSGGSQILEQTIFPNSEALSPKAVALKSSKHFRSWPNPLQPHLHCGDF